MQRGPSADLSAAVIVPVKAFSQGKLRLAPTLDPTTRAALARAMATAVVRAAGSLPVIVVCDDDDVRVWARSTGAEALWTPGVGLNGAVEAGVAHAATQGVGRVVVAHADLPFARTLDWVADFDGVTLVPDRHGDGTNVICVPADARFEFAYGAGSCARHQTIASRLALPTRVVPDAHLGWDVDVPADLDLPPDLDLPAEVADLLRDHRARGGHGSGGAMSTNLPTPSIALAIGAHPDDVEFGCGGTLAKWAKAGGVVHHLICTDGSKGSWDPTADVADLVVTRQAEQRAAAQALGATGQCVFLGWPDGELDSSLRQRWEVAYWIRRLQPAVVLGHDPWKRYRLHPDHRHAGLLACEGIVAARDPHFFPEQALPHHRPDALLLFEADEPDHVEDVAGFADVKLAALHRHTSQLRSTMHIDEGAPAAEVDLQRQAFDDRTRARLAAHGAREGIAEGEAFKLITNL